MHKISSLLVIILVLLIAGITSIKATTVYIHDEPYFSSVSQLLNAYGRQPPFGIRIKAPDIAEQASVVPVAVTAWGFDERPEYIRRVQIFSCTRPYTPIVDLKIPHMNFVEYTTRIRLRKTELVYAVAELNTGDKVFAAKNVKTTWGGCGGGGPNSPTVQAGPAYDSNLYNSSSWVRSSLVANRTRLRLRDGSTLEPDHARVNVHIDGFQARVVMDLEYRFNREVQDEGVFSLRLPDGASPYHIAFGENTISLPIEGENTGGIGGRAHWRLPTEELESITRPEATLKHAVMVPRKTARNAYINTVYRNIDPALVEWQGKGVFNVRVFPLMPGKVHRIVFAYDMPLREVAGSLHYEYLGLDPVARTDMTVSLPAHQFDDIIATSPHPVITGSGDRAVLSFNNLKESVHIALLDRETPVLQGRDETGEYFATRVSVDYPQQMLVPDTARAMFMLDTSLSSQPQSFNDYVKLLLSILRNNEDSIREFAVMYFDVGTRWWQDGFTANTVANRARLKHSLYQQSLSGATDLQRAFREATNPNWPYVPVDGLTWDVFLLSDGVATWGKTNPAEVNTVIDTDHIEHLYTYVTRDQAVDTSALHVLAEAHNGALYTLLNSSDVDGLSRAHRSLAWTLTSVAMPGASDVFVKGNPRHIYPGQRITVTGRGRPNVNELVLNMDAAGKAQQLRVRTGEVTPSLLAPRLFGQNIVEILESYELKSDAEKINFAGHFRVPRNTMSLLMLESEEDYQRFGIHTETDYTGGVRATRVKRLIQDQPRLKLLLPHFAVAPEMSDFRRQAERPLIADLCHLPVEVLVQVADLQGRQENVIRTVLPMDKRSIEQSSYVVDINPATQRQTFLNLGDRAERLAVQGEKRAGLRVLSNMIELDPANIQQRLLVAKTLRGMGEYEEAYYVLSQQPLPRVHRYSAQQDIDVYAELAESLTELGHVWMAMHMYEVEAGYRLRNGRPPSDRYIGVLLGLIGQGQSKEMERFVRERYRQLTRLIK